MSEYPLYHLMRWNVDFCASHQIPHENPAQFMRGFRSRSTHPTAR
jgi:hypothetical protein